MTVRGLLALGLCIGALGFAEMTVLVAAGPWLIPLQPMVIGEGPGGPILLSDRWLAPFASLLPAACGFALLLGGGLLWWSEDKEQRRATRLEESQAAAGEEALAAALARLSKLLVTAGDRFVGALRTRELESEAKAYAALAAASLDPGRRAVLRAFLQVMQIDESSLVPMTLPQNGSPAEAQGRRTTAPLAVQLACVALVSMGAMLIVFGALSALVYAVADPMRAVLGMNAPRHAVWVVLGTVWGAALLAFTSAVGLHVLHRRSQRWERSAMARRRAFLERRVELYRVRVDDVIEDGAASTSTRRLVEAHTRAALTEMEADMKAETVVFLYTRGLLTGHAPISLAGANLHNVDLCGRGLEGLSLPAVDLRGAIFTRANLRAACLSGCELSGADLRHADLRDANLTRARLRGARLQRADLHGAQLDEADLRDANCWETAGAGTAQPAAP